MLNVTVVVLIAAFVVAVVAAVGRAPLWVAVVLLAIAALLRELPR